MRGSTVLVLYVCVLEREPDNPDDVHAVAIKRAGRIVGHVPFNLAPTVDLSDFLIEKI